MTDVQETASLAEKLQWATPVSNGEPTQQANLSSSYLESPTWDVKTNAFLNDATIDTQISSAAATTSEAEAKAKAMGLDLSPYDPVAEAKAKELAAANARKQAEEEQKSKAKTEQREKIAQFLRWQSVKDRKLGYSKWVFSWILLTLWVVIIWTIVFKQNIIYFLENNLDNYLVSWPTMAAHLICDNIELPENIQLTEDERTNKIANLKKILTFGGSVTSYYSNIILSHMPTIWEAKADEIILMERESTNTSESIIEPEQPKVSYTFTPVESEEEANWVMTENCSELSCWDFSNESPENLVLCDQFRQKGDMDDSTPRIWHSGSCRYKDISELWYLSRE